LLFYRHSISAAELVENLGPDALFSTYSSALYPQIGYLSPAEVTLQLANVSPDNAEKELAALGGLLLAHPAPWLRSQRNFSPYPIWEAEWRGKSPKHTKGALSPQADWAATMMLSVLAEAAPERRFLTSLRRSRSPFIAERRHLVLRRFDDALDANPENRGWKDAQVRLYREWASGNIQLTETMVATKRARRRQNRGAESDQAD
jgi:hypothetical protein